MRMRPQTAMRWQELDNETIEVIPWLVVEPPNMISSVGMMTFPTELTNKSHVPNHQPVPKWNVKQLEIGDFNVFHQPQVFAKVL